MPMSSLLVVDDNQVDRERLRRLLRERHRIVEAATASEGVHLADSDAFDCVLLDYRLPDRDGTEVIGLFRDKGLPVLMLTGQGSEVVAVEAMKRGAHDYLNKNRLDAEYLERAIAMAIERHGLQREVARHRVDLEVAVAELESRREELERANRALAASEARLKVLLEQLPALAWTTGRDLGVRAMSGSALRVLGVGAPPPDTPVFAPSALVGGSPEAVDAHRRAVAGERARYRAEIRDRAFECTVEPLRDASGRSTGVIGVALDVTEVSRLEQRLAQAAKMEAIGMLAGGIAHDFNNLLTAIMGFVEFARERLPDESTARADLGEAFAAAERAVELVRQLLAFSRRDHGGSAADIDVTEVVGKLLPMLRRLLREDIRVEFRHAGSLWARMDRRELEQVVVNLAVNARDAMPRGGRLTVDVAPCRLDGELTDAEGQPLVGAFVALAVTDEGTGIPADALDRVFEPFFTTKPPGQGTGLGLSTCYGLVRRAGGTIVVESRPGATTFRVILPLVPEPTAAPPTDAGDLPRGTETILLVEDDAQVRAVVTRMLRQLGYTVVVAAGGVRAADVARGHPEPIDLVLSDVVMPEVDGPAAVAQVRALHPEAKALFMSGYVDGHSRPRALPPGVPVIEKPVRLDDLARRLRALLDAA